MSLRYRHLWHALGAGQVLLVTYLMLANINVHVEVSNIDKLVHWFLFTVMMSWYRQLTPGGRGAIVAIVAMTILAIGLEYLQGLNPNRSFEYADMAANVLGIISGLLLMAIPHLRYLQCLENHLP